VKQVKAVITSTIEAMTETRLLWVDAPEIAAAAWKEAVPAPQVVRAGGRKWCSRSRFHALTISRSVLGGSHGSQLDTV